MVAREPQRDPVGLEAGLPGRVAVVAGARLGRLPAAVVAAVALAWAVAIAAQAGGLGAAASHDALLADGAPALLGLLAFFLAWQVMVAAMMLPSSLPLVRLFAVASGRQPRPGAALGGFLGGYVIIWSGFGGLALAFDLGVHAVVESSPWLSQRDWLLGGGVLALAGAFQFTRLKEACLDKCRRPEQFLRRYYERGVAGGFRFGVRHGAFCVGCCWALMLVAFAVGMANLIWMALLTALMVQEKTRPSGERTLPVTGVALLAMASVVLLYGASVSG